MDKINTIKILSLIYEKLKKTNNEKEINNLHKLYRKITSTLNPMVVLQGDTIPQPL